jgi:uncharacterized protein
LRAEPERAFQHQVAMYYLDLDELPRLLGGRLLAAGPGILRFRRSDYHEPGQPDLAQSVRATVERSIGLRPAGPIRVLTTLRTLGYSFNPVSFYYCFESDGEQLRAVVAEVTNTPWKERHAYVLAGGEGKVEKRLHVSPFFGMDHSYECRLPAPGDRLNATIDSFRGRQHNFSAGLALKRRPLTAEQVRRTTLRYPFGSARVVSLIYGHAIGIRLAGGKVFSHPSSKGSHQ